VPTRELLPDVKLIDLDVHHDDRGNLFEVVRQLTPRRTAVDPPVYQHSVVRQFGQVYVVTNPARGAVRAFHKHGVLIDYFCIIRGSAKFVLVDDRWETDHDSNRAWCQAVLSGRTPKLLVVPAGVYHGWMSLEDNTTLLSIASEQYNVEDPDEVRVPPDHSPFNLPDVWTVEGR
jgi:dTDP-4-dehydrorhamnose 3,5-epimerase